MLQVTLAERPWDNFEKCMVGFDLHIGFRKISGERRCRCPLRVPFDPKVVALGVAYFQMDLSSVVQEAQTVAAGGDIVELRLLW